MIELKIKITKATEEEHKNTDWAWAWLYSYSIEFEDGYSILVTPNVRLSTIIEAYKNHKDML